MIKRILLLTVFMICAGCTGKGANLTFANFHNHSPASLRVVTYNVNWGHDEDFRSDPVKTMATLVKLKADILLLQETTKEWEKTLRQKLTKTYPYQDYLPTSNGGGKAILSRFPILKKSTIHSKFGWYPSQIALIKTPIGLIQFVNIHLTPTYLPHHVVGIRKISPFEAPNRRYQEIYHFYKHLKKNIPTVIAGDFNESDKGFAVKYLTEARYTDALLQNKEFFTWHRNYLPLVVKRRLDHVFYKDNLKAIRVQALYEGGSDHYPLVVDFEQG